MMIQLDGLLFVLLFLIYRMIGERYEGIRAYWHENALYTIRGKVLTPPLNFTQNMPKINLDGELWYIVFSLFCD